MVCILYFKPGKYPKVNICDIKRIPSRELETLIIHGLREIGKDKAILKSIASASKEMSKLDVKPLGIKEADLIKQLNEAKQKEQKLLDLLETKGSKLSAIKSVERRLKGLVLMNSMVR